MQGEPVKANSEFPGELTVQAPFLGENNAEVLRSYLGYSPARIAELEAAGILHHAAR